MNTRLNMFTTPGILIVALTISGFGLATFGLGKEPLWLDASWSWMMTQAAGDFMITHDVAHPPLYYRMLNLWVGWFGSNDFWIRMPSAIFYTLTIPIVYLIGRAIHSSKVGVLVAVLVATSPFIYHYARDARSYAMLLFICSIAFLCLAHLIREQPTKSQDDAAINWNSIRPYLLWSGLVISITLALFTNFVTTLLPVVTVAVLTIAALRHRRDTFRSLLIIAVAHIIILVVWIIHPYGLGELLYGLRGTSGSQSPGIFLPYKINMLIQLYGFGHIMLAAVIPAICVPLGWWQLRKDRKWNQIAFVTIAWLLPHVVFFVYELSTWATYKVHPFIWCTIPFYLIVSVGMCSVVKQWIFRLMICLVVSLNIFGISMEYFATQPPWDEIVDELVIHAKDGDAVVFCGVRVHQDFPVVMRPYWYQQDDAPNVTFHSIRSDGIQPPLHHIDDNQLWIITERTGARLNRCKPEHLNKSLQIEERMYQNTWNYGGHKLSILIGRFMQQLTIDNYPAGYQGNITMHGAHHAN